MINKIKEAQVPINILNFSKTESRLFLLGLLLKLLSGSFLVSFYLTDLFIPFVTEFAVNPFENPYRTFLENGAKNIFPYPAVMLYMLSAFIKPITILFPGSLIASIIAVRLIILITDAVTYFLMRSWLPENSRKRFTILFWLNPVTFYISYVHGQLDVIAIAFLVVSLWFLFSAKMTQSAVFYAVALAAKTSVILILPLYLLYFFQKQRTVLLTAIFSFIVLLTFFALNLQFIFDTAFIEMVFKNQEQSKLLNLSLNIGELSIYWVIVLMAAITAFGYKIGITNKNLFLMFVCFYFSAVLIALPPMYGWYWWIIPFFAYFFALEAKTPIVLFICLQFFYFAYFLISPTSDYAQILQLIIEPRPAAGFFYIALKKAGADVDFFLNVTFTFLQTILLMLCVQVLYSGLLRYRIEKISGTPFLLGIGGNSGVGKTSLASDIEDLFGIKNTTVLQGDDRHKWQRGADKWTEYTHLNPKANFLHAEINTLLLLKKGKKVWRRLYDHDTGKFTEELPIIPNRLMVLEGLHPFYLSGQRKLFDLRVFIDPQEELALHWKICRDRQKRGHSIEKIMSQIQSRENDFEMFIAAQRPFADIVISPRSDRKIESVGDENAQFNLEYEITFKNTHYIDEEVSKLEAIEGLDIEHFYTGTEHQAVKLSGNLNKRDLKLIYGSLLNELQNAGVGTTYIPSGLKAGVVFFSCKCDFERSKKCLKRLLIKILSNSVRF